MFVALAPETVLQNRYRIISRLDKPKADGKGKGGMGAVYLAEDSWLSCEVAIKQTFSNDDADLADEITKAFQGEAKLLANLRHSALPRVTNHFPENNGQFLVMDLIRGEDLDDVRLRHGGRLPLELALKLTDQLLEVLHYLHSQNPPVIHRDIKPSNLKLTESEQLMLLDFGLAKGTLGLMTHHNHRSLFAMTEAYAPPEQIEGEITEARSDLFSFGATFYELLTGQTPPHALTKRAFEIAKKKPDPLCPIHELNVEVPKEVSDIFTEILSLDIEKRPASAAILRQKLSVISKKTLTGETTVVKERKTANRADSSSPTPENKAKTKKVRFSLNETYSICGETFKIYAKMGQYVVQDNSYMRSYKFSREDYDEEESYQEESFQITEALNLSEDIELELGDHISMAMFGRNGSLFLLFNHRNSKYKYYPESVMDLIWSLKSGWISDIFNSRKLAKATEAFTATQTFSNVLKKLKSR